jgi:ankyrin repeat protein
MILRIYKMDDLYLRPNASLIDDFIAKLKEKLICLSCKILEFQARALCYLKKSSFDQYVRGMFKIDPWDALLQDMKNFEDEAKDFTALIQAENQDIAWKRCEEEIKNASKQHQIWQTTSVRDQKLNKFFQLLFTCNYRETKERNRRRVPGTCEWFIHHHLFKEWNESSKSSLLWVSADPGCGKSVLAKFLVDEVIQVSNNRKVCYFFFKDDSLDQKTAMSALASLLRQIFMTRPELVTQTVLDQWERDGDKLVQSFESLWDILISVTSLQESGEIVLVIDALDECQDHDRIRLIQKVEQLYLSNDNRGLRFLMTSRPYGHIRSAFQKLENKSPTIHLHGEGEKEIQSISKEIDLVVASRVHDIAERKLLESHERELLYKQLTNIPLRTYLWVTLVMDYIENITGFTKAAFLRAIGAEIPVNVNDAYDKMLNQSPDHAKAMRLLHIVIAVKRPLLVEELLQSYSTKEGYSDDDIKDEMEPAERFKSTIRDLCGLLLTVIDQKVYLFHQTVKDFLVPGKSLTKTSASSLWHHSFVPTESHKLLANICMWTVQVYEQPRGCNGFTQYAYDYWADHFREAHPCDGDATMALAMCLCAPEWIQSRGWPLGYKTGFPGISTVLIAASYFGLNELVSKLLATQEEDVNSRDDYHQRTALAWATVKGHDTVVRLLLQTANIEVDTKNSWLNKTPFSLAAERGNETVVKMLLQTGQVDVNSKDDWHQTPLLLAAAKGHEAVVKLLIQSENADFDSGDSSNESPLLRAAKNGHERVVKLFLENGQVAVNMKDTRWYMTPLAWAAMKGHEAVVKLLLQSRQVEINSRDKDQRTPLFWAAYHGHEAVVKLLIQHGQTEIDSKDKDQRTPFSWAAQEGHEAIVRSFLQTGRVEVDSRSQGQQTPLLLAAKWGRTAVVKLLLQTGQVDVNSHDASGLTPYTHAEVNGRTDVMELLVSAQRAEKPATLDQQFLS